MFTVTIKDNETGEEFVHELEGDDLADGILAGALGKCDDGEWSWQMQEKPETLARLDALQAFITKVWRHLYEKERA